MVVTSLGQVVGPGEARIHEARSNTLRASAFYLIGPRSLLCGDVLPRGYH